MSLFALYSVFDSYHKEIILIQDLTQYRLQSVISNSENPVFFCLIV